MPLEVNMIRKLHHIGIASRNIQADMSFYGLLGYAAKGALREDVDGGRTRLVHLVR